MPLVNSKNMLLKALSNNYAVPALNFTNLEQLQTILFVAEKLGSPIIIQASKSAIEYMGISTLIAVVKAETQNLKVDVCLNLDHGNSVEFCEQMIDAGFTNVMLDMSAENIDKNIENTKLVVDYAHAKNVTVEAELGSLKGVEDEKSCKNSHFTNPEDALKFVEATNVDSLAISIGTSHGAYKFEGESFLDIQRLKEISKLTKIPLVLHGASSVSKELKQELILSGGTIGNANGVSTQNLLDAIKNGICKINCDTDLRIAFTTGIRNELKNSSEFNLRKYLTTAKNTMAKLVEEKIQLFGSIQKN